MRENKLIIACVSLLLGILFIVNPGGSGKVIAVIAGCVVLIAGITNLVRHLASDEADRTANGSLQGIIMIILGLFMLTHVSTIIALLSYIFGIILLVAGTRSLENTLRLRREGLESSSWNILLAALVMLVGVFMLFVPHGTVNVAIFIVGVILVIYAVAELYYFYKEKPGNS